jgi:Na+/melibiose symporter-like transporter
MNAQDFDTLLLYAAGLSIFIAGLNVFFSRRRGKRSLYMAAASVAMAGGLLAYRSHASEILVVLCGVLAVGGVIADAWFRFQESEAK